MTDEIEFRSLDLYDPGGIYFEVTKGFLVPMAVRGTDYVVAAKAGRSAGNRVSDKLSVVLTGYVVGTSPEDYFANRRELLAKLDENNNAAGTLTVKGPLYGMNSGDVATLVCRVANFIEGPATPYYVHQTWSIELEAIEAWAFAAAGS